MKNLDWNLLKTGMVIIVITFSVYVLIGQVLNIMPDKYIKDIAQVFVCVYLYQAFRKTYKREKKTP